MCKYSLAIMLCVVGGFSEGAVPTSQPAGERVFEKNLAGHARLLAYRQVTETHERSNKVLELKPGPNPLQLARVERFSIYADDSGATRKLWEFEWRYYYLLTESAVPGKLLDLRIEGDRAFVIFQQGGTTALWVAKLEGPPPELDRSPGCVLSRSPSDFSPIEVRCCTLQGTLADDTMTVLLETTSEKEGRKSHALRVTLKDDKVSVTERN